MAGAGPYHHSLSNLMDTRKMSIGEVGKPIFFIIPREVPVNEPFNIYCTINPDGLYEFTCDEVLVEHISGNNYATITPLITGTCHVSARWFRESGEEYIYGDAKLSEILVSS